MIPDAVTSNTSPTDFFHLIFTVWPRIFSKRNQFFHSELSPIEKGDTNANDRIASHKM